MSVTTWRGDQLVTSRRRAPHRCCAAGHVRDGDMPAPVERGIRRFRCMVMADNDAMQALLLEVDPKVIKRHDQPGVTSIEMTLPEPEPSEPIASVSGDPLTASRESDGAREPGSGLHVLSSAVHRLLSFVAEQRVAVPFRSRLPSPPEEGEPLP